MTHRKESPRRVARWLADSFPQWFHRRRRPIVRRPEEARRFLPLLESIESRESATLLSVSGIGLAATEIALLSQPDEAAASTQNRPLFADDTHDSLNPAGLLAGSAGLSVSPQDNAGNPAPDIIGRATAAPAAPASDADALFSIVSNPLPDLTSGGRSAGSSFGNSAAAPGGGGDNSGGGGGGAAGAIGFNSGGGGGAAAPVLAKSPSPAELFTFSPATPISVAPAASQAGSAGVLQTAGSDTGVPTSSDSTPTPAPSSPSLATLDTILATPSIPPGNSPPPHPHGSGDPLFVIDVNKQLILTPGVPENDFSTWSVSLYAQVSGGTVSTYSWNTSQAADATSISGSSTYNLQFSWGSFTGGPRTDTITITTTNTDQTQQSETLTFKVWGTNTNGYSGSPPSMPGTWPVAISPDAVQGRQATVSGAYYRLGLDTGELQAGHVLDAYNPGVAPLGLLYSSLAAEQKPTFVVHYRIDPSQAVPTTVSAQLTFNGSAGQTYYYDTSASHTGNPMLNPGDVLQMALQADATSLSTGRYSYSIAVTANYGTPVTTTLSGSADIVNSNSSPFGAGWSLANLSRIWSVTGGVVLELPGGASLWFASAGGGTYTTPAGDFSTLALANNVYTRTLPDGTQINFDSNGKQTSIVDTNGNTTTFAWNGSNLLTAITDMNAVTTTFAYNGSSLLTSITDPASHATTFAYAQGRLTSITDPDTAAYTYGYSGSTNRINAITNPRSNTWTVSYNSANRVSSVSRPNSTSESLTAVQLQGWVAAGSGTSGNPAAPTLLAQASGQYTDPRSNTWTTFLDWSGFGLGTEAQDPLADTLVNVRDANGLPWLVADQLGNRERSFFDSKGNPTTIAMADDAKQLYAYNSFSEPTQATDPTGSVTTLSYDSHGNLTQLTQADPDGGGPLSSPVWNYTYTAKGSVSTATDPLSHTTTYAYDSRNRLTSQTDASNHTLSYAYDSASHVTSVTNERGYATAYTFDAMGRVLTKVLPDANSNNHPTYTAVYDAAGNRTSLTDPLSHTTTFGFDALNRQSSMTDPLSHTTTYGHDAAGNTTSVTDALSRTTTYAFDSASRLTAVTDALSHTTTYGLNAAGWTTSATDALSHTTTYSYTARGFLASKTDPLSDVEQYSYNAAGDLTDVTQSGSGIGSPEESPITYDALHRLLTVTDPLGNTTTYGYDAASNLTKQTDPLGHTISYGYDALNRPTSVTDALSHTTTFGYDPASNRTGVTDPLNHTTTSAFDPQNRVTAVTDALNHTVSYGYDLAGRETSRTDPDSNVWGYSYDNANRVTAVTDPLNHTTTYAYDAANQPTSVTDRNSRQRTFAYDNAGRQTSETWWSGGTAIYTASYAYDAANRMTSASDNSSTYTMAYDSANRVTSVDNNGTTGAPHVALTYSYDVYSNRTNLSDNLGGSIGYSYDADNRLTDVGFGSGMQHRDVGLAYDGAGRLTSVTDTSRFSSTLTGTYAFDAANRVTGITYTSSDVGTLDTFTYSYDAADRVTGYTGPEGTVTYSYDNTNQLTGASGARSETYTYDANGNRTMSGYSTGTGNRLTSDGTYNYAYDNEGNLRTRTTIADNAQTTYAWDNRNRLTEVVVKNSSGQTVTDDVFTYDVANRRIAKSVNGTKTWTIYDRDNPYADFNSSLTKTEQYISGLAIDQVFARNDGTTVAYYLRDIVNSVRDVVKIDGTVLDHIDYDSFGKITNETSSANGDRFKFTGREWDSEIAQYFYRARYYSASIGRFESEDPVGFAGRDTNLSRYVHNNPEKATDPEGLFDPPPPFLPPPFSSPLIAHPAPMLWKKDLIPPETAFEASCRIEQGNPGLGNDHTPLILIASIAAEWVFGGIGGGGGGGGGGSRGGADPNWRPQVDPNATDWGIGTITDGPGYNQVGSAPSTMPGTPDGSIPSSWPLDFSKLPPGAKVIETPGGGWYIELPPGGSDIGPFFGLPPKAK